MAFTSDLHNENVNLEAVSIRALVASHSLRKSSSAKTQRPRSGGVFVAKGPSQLCNQSVVDTCSSLRSEGDRSCQ